MTGRANAGPVNAVLNVYAFFVILLLCSGYALAKGGAPERIAAAIMICGAIGSFIAINLGIAAGAERYFGVQRWTLTIDLAMLVAWVILAVWSTRFWPIWVAACQGLLVATHLAAVATLIHPWAYWALQMLWSYPVPIILAIGTYRHRKRLLRDGTDLSWKPSLRW
ncbi:hypothetical protein ACNI3Q_00470 [Sphingomonas sp. FW199]|uniref:hypothetical protein n=1 Tax=Sphingomonas sp. FW199 TaxID=3400217 RepID=UPI003CF4FCC2